MGPLLVEIVGIRLLVCCNWIPRILLPIVLLCNEAIECTIICLRLLRAYTFHSSIRRRLSNRCESMILILLPIVLKAVKQVKSGFVEGWPPSQIDTVLVACLLEELNSRRS